MLRCMVRRLGRVVEIESLADFDEVVSSGSTRTRGWRVQDVDLTQRTGALLGLEPAGSLWLGCTFAPAAADHLRSGGGLVFPQIPDLPFDPYRARLYSPDELYAGVTATGYEDTLDAKVYAWSQHRDDDVEHVIAAAVHDQSIDDALDEFTDAHRTVGVMGGHALLRGDPLYAAAARLGGELARSGLLVATGGGPGAMEAANLGAQLSHEQPGILDAAVEMLAAVPSFRPSVADWVRGAFAVRERWPASVETLGIPTWFYGHEPPNAFATAIAKFFQNSVREDTLLRHCDGGVVFLPGAAGTVQEIFQNACENHYAPASAVVPMVLVGVDHWTRGVPAWPLLERLASNRPMEPQIHLVDSIGDVPALLLR